ncbi:MAG: acyltransferase [Bacteroidetes bacterium HGW-Bacteroidetes-13]|nr:MAG: acyltransferase [Bacteroidetes bacterium HGW-Bacteroidetes-13]
MKWICAFIYQKLLGWKVVGQFPELRQYVVIVAPHTSWHDFYMGILIRKMLAVKVNFVAKKELFIFPFGWLFRALGGFPIDRTEGQNTVSNSVALFHQFPTFKLAIAPEGTRKKVERWKTGFYHIAKMAKVPIVMVSFDYGRKEHCISEPFYPTNDETADFVQLHRFFEKATGKIPENF